MGRSRSSGASRPSTAPSRRRSGSEASVPRVQRIHATLPVPSKPHAFPCETEMRVTEDGRKEVVFRFEPKHAAAYLPPSMQGPPRTPVTRRAANGPPLPLSDAINNMSMPGDSRGWTTGNGEYGLVKPPWPKECAGDHGTTLWCNPNHPHWAERPDVARAYVGLSSSYMDLGQSFPPVWRGG